MIKSRAINSTTNGSDSNYITYGQMNLINDFRDLWTDLIVWMRSFVVSTLSGFGNISAISNRLFRIPQDFSNIMKTVFGVSIAEELQHYFLMQIVYAQSIVNSLKAGDQQATDTAVANLYKNAIEMSDFLAGINPYWNKDQWQNMLFQLYEMAIAELVALNSGDYERELQIFDRMKKLGLLMGDYMARGVMYYVKPEITK